MTTISVPLPAHLEEFVKKMVKEGNAVNKAEVVRMALKFFAEREAIEAVLRAQNEPTLRGDLRKLAKRII